MYIGTSVLTPIPIFSQMTNVSYILFIELVLLNSVFDLNY